MTRFETLRSWLKSQTGEMVQLEKLLTSIPAIAPDSGGDGETKKCDALEKYLRDAGFTHIERFEAPDPRVSSGNRPNMIATIEGENDDFSIWVMAHMDVVPVGDMASWTSDPWQLVQDGDKIIGRGVEDNQQGLVSGVFAALACIKNNIVPAHTVKLLFMADEEFGSTYGIKYLLKNHRELFRKQDLILIPDGGDSKGETIEIAEKNILWLKLHTKGLQAHGSLPNRGKNACLAANDLSLRLNGLEKVFGDRDPLFDPDYSTFQPTKRESNVQTVNIIPGDDVFYMDCRILPRYTLDMVRAEVKKCVKEVEEQYGVTVEVSEVQTAESPATPVSSPVVKRLSKALKDAHGIDARTIGIGGGTVGAELRNEGFDCAIWSSLDEMCHQPNEYCLISNLERDSETLASLFLQE